jgi:hypothetical protein
VFQVCVFNFSVRAIHFEKAVEFCVDFAEGFATGVLAQALVVTFAIRICFFEFGSCVDGAVSMMCAERVRAAGEVVCWACGGGEEMGCARGVEAGDVVFEWVVLSG